MELKLYISYMRKIVLLLLVLISSLSYGQVKQFSTDSIEVLDKSGVVKVYECKSKFTYTRTNCMLLSNDIRVYNFLIPGSSFMDLDLLVFMDTGYSVDMSDTTMIFEDDFRNIPENHKMGVVYQTSDGGTTTQLIQYVDSSGIYFVKRDQTQIKFR